MSGGASGTDKDRYFTNLMEEYAATHAIGHGERHSCPEGSEFYVARSPARPGEMIVHEFTVNGTAYVVGIEMPWGLED